MSFRCDTCQIAQPAGTRPATHVITTRPRLYNTPNGEIPGSEISKEVRVCPTCAETIVPALTAITLADKLMLAASEAS